MTYKVNLGKLGNPNPNIFIPITKPLVGRVFAVVTNENTPTKKQYERAGGKNGVGSIFYKEWDKNKNEIYSITDSFLDGCDIAKPINQNNLDYPLPDELVLLQTLPSAADLDTPSDQKYYTGVIGIWNNNQHNAQPSGDRYNFKTFNVNEDIRNLLRFEGDKIIQGRKGNSIRFGSTVQSKAKLNEWSSGPGADGDPIIIMSNSHDVNSKSIFHIEQINKEYSSIYLTSTQQIPLQPDRNDVVNPLTKPLKPSEYYGPQILVNGDRVILNSKKDDILVYATTNIELNTNNVINLNAKERVHFNSSKVFLGTDPNGSLPDEPLMLGIQTLDFLSKLMLQLSLFCSSLSSTKSTPEGTDLIQVQAAATKLNNFLTREMGPDKLTKLISTRNYTN